MAKIDDLRAWIAEMRAWIAEMQEDRRWRGAAAVEPRGTIEQCEAAWLKLGSWIPKQAGFGGSEQGLSRRFAAQDAVGRKSTAGSKSLRRHQHAAVHGQKAKRANEDA
ncbi:hypothetical protein PR003_g9036 [Phytophthora rubi]|uniref:Uncharacterized protein n=1 Tax=Phytophthora rubi TaxID=129364 RepID=A0A6A3MJJ0_9STRA|nr:hypothetical protein PR002_g8999 [Phytophthora rubi]KAE9037205.1 hypothetical protein PR001_g8469 [Phytophthora rubi]KAE9343317.1 hypothetical protein PR003_g9036 [Phytophthora rubi]